MKQGKNKQGKKLKINCKKAQLCGAERQFIFNFLPGALPKPSL